MTETQRLIVVCAIWQAIGALRAHKHEDDELGAVITCLLRAEAELLEGRKHLKVVE